MLSNIIFDLDGVLWSSNKAHATAYKECFSKFDLDINYSSIAGKKTIEVFKDVNILHKLNLSNDEIDILVLKKQNLAWDILRSSNSILEPNIRETLIALSRTYNLFIATSSSNRNLSLFLEMTNSHYLFKKCISGEQVEYAKPNPAIYKIFNNFGCLNKNSIVIEDSYSGIESAKNAGYDVVVKLGTHVESDFNGFNVEAMINKISDLLNYE